MKKLGLGCLGLLVLGIGLIVILVATSAGRGSSPQTTTAQGAAGTRSAPAANPRAEAAPIGDTAQRGNWEMTVVKFGPWDQFASRPPSTSAQGRLMVVEFTAKNLHQQTSQFGTQDFVIEAGDGRKFQPASATASIDKGFTITQRVQPGLTTENRLVFDLDPAASDLVLIGLGMYFRLAP